MVSRKLGTKKKMDYGEIMNLNELTEQFAKLLHLHWVKWSFTAIGHLVHSVELLIEYEVDEIYLIEDIQNEARKWKSYWVPYDNLPEQRKLYYRKIAVEFISKLLDSVNEKSNQIENNEENINIGSIEENKEEGN